MTDPRPPDDPHEIESILADLEAILSDKPIEGPEKPKEPGIENIVAGLGEVFKKPGVSPPPPPPPALTPPPPKPTAPPAATPVPPPAMPPPAAAPVSKPPPPIPAPPPPAVKPPAAPPPASPPKPPIEIRLEIPGLKLPAAPPPLPAPPPAAAKPPAAPPPMPVQPPPPAQPPPAAASQQMPETIIPPDAPKDQIRRVAFLYSGGQKTPFAEFIRFVEALALQFSKKPLYLRRVLLAEVSPTDDLQGIPEKLRNVGAVGVVGVLPGVQDNKLRALETGLTAANISFYWLTPEEAFKRPVVLGLVVELMLLNSE